MLNKRVVNFFSLSLLLIICTLNPPQKALAEASSSSGMLDIDGNGSYDALTDGLLILRYLFGLSGDSLIAGVVANVMKAGKNQSMRDRRIIRRAKKAEVRWTSYRDIYQPSYLVCTYYHYER